MCHTHIPILRPLFVRMKKRLIVIAVIVVCSVLRMEAASKKALLIGISEYPTYSNIPQSSWTSIHGINDISLISPVLQSQGFSVRKLLDKHATATNIRKALTQLSKDAQQGDLVYIHFSCHGQAFEDLSGDETDGWDEAVVPYDARISYIKGVYEGANHILDDELEIFFTSIRRKIGTQGFLYVVLDACHMGGASRGEETEEYEVYVRGTDSGFTLNNKRYVPKIDKRGNMQVTSKPLCGGICIIEACRAYQTNAEIKQNGKFYGPLSYYITQTLKTEPLNNNTDWTVLVRKAMNTDIRLVKQNMVIEQTNK